MAAICVRSASDVTGFGPKMQPFCFAVIERQLNTEPRFVRRVYEKYHEPFLPRYFVAAIRPEDGFSQDRTVQAAPGLVVLPAIPGIQRDGGHG